MIPNEIEPLPADPVRQADAMLRACDYQILQTVNAWLDLRGEEVLYVEGTEDFDKHSATRAEAVQVKASPRPISLAQKGTQGILNNFWKLREAAAGRTVRFRVLTCAPFVVERQKPFGKNVAGLEIWRRNPMTDDETKALAVFLRKQRHIAPAFKCWLERATPELIRKELIACVTWQTHAEDAHFVERGIHNKLAIFGEKRGPVPASVTKQIALRLDHEVRITLRSPPPRRLDFIRLEELWEEGARVSMPRSAYDALLNRGILRLDSSTHEPVDMLQIGTPPLPGKVAHRSMLVGQLRDSLAINGFLNITGSTRTGKTTLAKLIASPDADSWRWWSAARLKYEHARLALASLVRELARLPDVSSVILDDLDLSPTAILETEESLGELISLLRNRRGRIVITSQKPLPSRLRYSFGINAEQVVTVPRMNNEEVEDLAAELGCMDKIQRVGWARLIRAFTGGHPQLVAIRILALRDQSWPAFSAEALDLGTKAIDAERADTRQLLDGLPAPQRELLQRLSAFPVAFRRDHAVALGAIPPPLSSPGNSFDPLIGPWVEPLHGGYFALSPLLANGASADLTPEDFEFLQNGAAKVLIKSFPYTTFEAANAFLLGWQTHNANLLTGIALSWVECEDPIAISLAEDLRWFAFVNVSPGKRLFAGNVTLSSLLRLLQFRVASLISSEQTSAIYNAWRWEIENGDHPEPVLHLGLLATQVLYTTKNTKLPAALWVQSIGHLSEFTLDYPDMPLPGILPAAEGSDVDYLPKWNDPVSAISFICGMNCESVEFLDEFLTSLGGVVPEMRERILRGFVGCGVEARMAVDRVWLAESNRNAPDWKFCVHVFDRALRLGQQWHCVALADAGAAGLSIVLDEYLLNRQAAHETLNRISVDADMSPHVFHDRRASIFFSEGNYAAAEEHWRLAFMTWPKPIAPFDTYAAFAARGAGVAAAKLEKWTVAAAWFRSIIEYLPYQEHTALMAGAYADAGYCLWRAGAKVDTIAALIEAWKYADLLPPGREDFRAFVTRKTIGHVIAWLHGEVSGGGVNLHEPIAGTCSSAEMPEKMRELPETESASVWFFLTRLESELNAGCRARELGGPALLVSKDLSIRSLLAVEAIAQDLVTGNVVALPAQLISMARAIHASAARAPEHLAIGATRVVPENFEKEDALRGASVFLAGIISAQAHGRGWQETISDWRASLPSFASEGWNEWFELMERILGGSAASAYSLLSASRESWPESMLGAWNLLLSDEASPEYVFAAHVRWLCSMAFSPWFGDTAAAFCRQTETAWGRAIRTPALLRQPRTNIPEIELACADGMRGLAKSARILLAASPAVSLRMPSDMAAAIRKLASG